MAYTATNNTHDGRNETIGSKELPPQERYQFKPFIGSSHTWALNILESLPITSRLLDIGSGSGLVGQQLGTKGFTQLFAVEPDSEARLATKHLYLQIEPSIEQYSGQSFDVIVLLDVLEHTPNPEAFLANVFRLLSSSGTAIVSVPNVVHWSVRLLIMAGFFNYTERGILDKTHLHFFTRKTLLKMVKKHKDLKVIDSNSSIVPFQFLLPKLVWNNSWFDAVSRFRHRIAQIFPNLFAYQVLLNLKKD